MEAQESRPHLVKALRLVQYRFNTGEDAHRRETGPLRGGASRVPWRRIQSELHADVDESTLEVDRSIDVALSA